MATLAQGRAAPGALWESALGEGLALAPAHPLGDRHSSWHWASWGPGPQETVLRLGVGTTTQP